MLRKIRLYGRLARFIGRRTLYAAIDSATDAIRFLLANFPQLEAHMAEQHYKVFVGEYALSVDELAYPSGMQDISIVPVIGGAGGTFGRILAGVALVALSFVNFGGTALAGALAKGAWASGLLFSLGSSLVLGGIAAALSPVPTLPQGIDSLKDPRKSYNFSGIQQNSRQGLPVPIVYGRTVTGSVVISSSVDTVEVVR